MQNNELDKFYAERAKSINDIKRDKILQEKSLDWMVHADKHKYTYNFSWMGRPIIKFPADIVVQQELMWSLRPDLIIETGIAHGGSLIFSASMLEMMAIDGEVVGVDIDIRPHNRDLIQAHPMSKRITMYEGSSTDLKIVEMVKSHTTNKKTILLILDSLHSHEHVLEELRMYSPLVTVGSYCVLPDTFIEFFPKGHFADDRPWDVGNNPYTAMKQFLYENKNFCIDEELSGKAVITESIDGYLKKLY